MGQALTGCSSVPADLPTKVAHPSLLVMLSMSALSSSTHCWKTSVTPGRGCELKYGDEKLNIGLVLAVSLVDGAVVKDAAAIDQDGPLGRWNAAEPSGFVGSQRRWGRGIG